MSVLPLHTKALVFVHEAYWFSFSQGTRKIYLCVFIFLSPLLEKQKPGMNGKYLFFMGNGNKKYFATYTTSKEMGIIISNSAFIKASLSFFCSGSSYSTLFSPLPCTNILLSTTSQEH